jgi:hypothetical protein
MLMYSLFFFSSLYNFLIFYILATSEKLKHLSNELIILWYYLSLMHLFIKLQLQQLISMLRFSLFFFVYESSLEVYPSLFAPSTYPPIAYIVSVYWFIQQQLSIFVFPFVEVASSSLTQQSIISEFKEQIFDISPNSLPSVNYFHSK